MHRNHVHMQGCRSRRKHKNYFTPPTPPKNSGTRRNNETIGQRKPRPPERSKTVAQQKQPAERWAKINTDAIAHNVATIRSHIQDRTLIAVVKADGYGHSAPLVARAALDAGATMLGTAHLREALELREAGITAPILCWLHTPLTTFETALEADIQLGASGSWDLTAIAQAAQATGITAQVHLKVDTGLGRNGSTPASWPALLKLAASYEQEKLIKVTGIFSHLAVADEPTRTETQDQLQAFHQATQEAHRAGLTPQLLHLANSPATLNALNTQDPQALLCNAVRVGLALYGLSPFQDQSAQDLGLRPAMTFGTYINAVKEVPAGQGVSYGLRYRTTQPTTFALIPVGYADGVPRIAENAPVRIYPSGDQARTYTVVGRIAMDQMIIDLGQPGLSDPSLGYLGAPAILFGEGDNPPVEAWADAAGTINYEIITRISPRVDRIPTTDAES